MATSSTSTYGTGADYTNYSSGGTSEYDSMSGWEKFGLNSMDWIGLSGKKDKSEKINPYGSLNPEQIAMVRYLGPYIGNQISKGPQYYTGELSADMDPMESNYYNQSRADLMSGTLDDFLKQGSDQTAFNDRFNRDVATPTYDNFNQNELPGLLEGYSGFSTAAGNARAKALSTIGNNLLQQRYSGQEAAKDRALGAYDKYSDVGNYVSVPRSVKQAGLDRQYTDYVNANNRADSNINSALQFLGLSTGTYQPAQQDTRGMALLSTVASIVSSLYGGKGGSTAVSK